MAAAARMTWPAAAAVAPALLLVAVRVGIFDLELDVVLVLVGLDAEDLLELRNIRGWPADWQLP